MTEPLSEAFWINVMAVWGVAAGLLGVIFLLAACIVTVALAEQLLKRISGEKD